MESENIPVEIPSHEEIKNEESNTNNQSLEVAKEEKPVSDLSQNESKPTDLHLVEEKDLVKLTMEEVRLESVEINNTTVTEEIKPKSPSFLQGALKSIKELVSYYTSCSVKKPQENNVPN